MKDSAASTAESAAGPDRSNNNTENNTNNKDDEDENDNNSTDQYHPRATIKYAEWPRDAPSALERNIITIVCGNTSLHWALHEGSMNKFIPIMFWYTIHDASKEASTSDDPENDGLSADPCDILEAHVASQAHTLIFGEAKKSRHKRQSIKPNVRDVSKTAAKRDAPGISVFVVSSNPVMEEKICYMFRGVPAKIFKLKNTDFFSAEQGVYPTMGTDRAAALYGARMHYGSPALVIDGGTAMTYTMLNQDSMVLGGGISPGVKVRLQSLADYTGALPSINHQQFKTAVETAIANKKPLPFFAKDTEMAMIVPVCAELSCQLRNIIKQYVAKCCSEESSTSSSSTVPTTEGKATSEQAPLKRSKFPVIITGGDGKFLKDLLQDDASNIISVEPDAAPIPLHSVEIRHVKNLVTYALGDVLYEKHCQKPNNDPEERLRLKIQGLRIAAPAIDQKEIFTRGCVFNITPVSMIEGYIFHARFDNGAQKDLTLIELYDALVLYNEIGEKEEPEDKENQEASNHVDEDWVLEKKMWSRKVQEELGNVSRLIRNRIRQLKPHIEKGELLEIFKKRSSIESRIISGRTPRKKKAKHSPPTPREYLGKRIAKRFPIDHAGFTTMEPTETAGDQIFFGTVKYISDSYLNWYFIRYDDGDTEELAMADVVEGIGLYQVHKFNDPMHSDPENHTSKPLTGLPQGSQPVRVLLHTDFKDDNDQTFTAYTDLSTLLGMSAEGNNRQVVGMENVRRISEFKEDI